MKMKNENERVEMRYLKKKRRKKNRKKINT